MTTKLTKYFPMLKEREALLAEIAGDSFLKHLFQEWTEEQQEEFLDFCTGVRGIKFLYDSFFKEIMDPETAPERLEEFLSLILKKKIEILEVLPTDSTRIADETTLLVMDIVVQLEDGPIVNLEVQKIGYKFPGERCACYSSDLLLRQYKRVRSQKKKKFSYKDIKGVYTIVLFEKSPKEFRDFPDEYYHHAKQEFDTGIKMNLLQEYVFIALDIYKEIHHNKIKNKCEKQFDNKLEAWLALLCMDEPEVVVRLSEQYPEFKAMYEEVYRLCLNTEGVMQMFSKELAELDRNTVQLMIDEMQDEINAQKRELAGLIKEKEKVAEEKEKITKEKDKVTEEKEKITKEKEETVKEKDKIVKEKDEVVKEKEEAVKEKDKVVKEKDKQVKEEISKRQTMIRAIYSNIQNIEQVSKLTGCSVEEIEEALQ